ncbi:hypothetical protein [Bradyrhizobium japonicum]|uniref:hypothetical protein n=1 Tax=Bradyrhizobium japonicum TaxID=375 RepID=UPI0005766D47|nr:hypothetical protein [Bradyrhizobium japonicum]
MIDEQKKGGPVDFASWAALLGILLASLSLMSWLLLLCRSGFDLTDEGFYLHSIAEPGNYPYSVTQFGFVYHPLYKLVGGDVSLLRGTNLLISISLGFLLSWAIVLPAFGPWSLVSRSTRAAVIASAFAVAVASLSFFALWLPTPNYNTLTFQSLLIAATGFALVREPRYRLAGWLLIGLGGGGAFLAKPTTAAALAFIALLHAAIAGRLQLREVLVAAFAAVALLASAALLIDSSLHLFFDRMAGGLKLAELMLPFQDGVLKSFSPEFLHFSHEAKVRFVTLFGTYLTIGVLCFTVTLPARIAAALIILFSSALSIFALFGFVVVKATDEPGETYLLLAGAAGITAASALVLKAWPSRQSIATACVLFLLPFALAVGTNANGWMTAGRAGFFWLMIGLLAACRLAVAQATWRPLLCVGSLSLVGTTILVHLATEFPYRQTEPLRLQRRVTEVGPAKTRLVLTEQRGALISGLHRLAAEGGFEAGQPMLDLTGESPGLVYALGARPLGVGWTLGGYPGSAKFVLAGLSWESCAAIGASWILSSETSRGSISPDFLREVGIDARSDYQDVGTIESDSTFAQFPKMHYHLLRPARSQATSISSCESARGE